MKILPVTQFNIVNFRANTKETAHQIPKKEVGIIGGVATAALVAGGLAYKHQTDYLRVLAKDLSKELGEKISSKDLKCVMTKQEMLKELSKLSEQNYVASAENIKNGIFQADLHSHSNYSDGQISVANLLEEAANYGDKLNKMNGKKFIFALSDHDGVEGVKEALKIIAQNPKKFENVKFVPASEVSFIFPCQKNSERFKRFNSEVQMPEMLVFGLNPFSKKTNDFFNSIYESRLQQIFSAMNKACFHYHTSDFNNIEYRKFYTNPDKKLCFLNQHWRIWNYIHTKFRVVQMAREQGKDANSLYSEIMTSLKADNKQLTPYELSEYIKRNNIQTQSSEIDVKLKKMLEEEIFPQKIDENTPSSSYEKTIDDIMKYAKDEDATLGFAHPAFTMQNMDKDKCFDIMKNIIKKSRGCIKFAEKHHQAYPIGKEISEAELKEYNEILDKLKLINIGGRDNHSDIFIR